MFLRHEKRILHSPRRPMTLLGRIRKRLSSPHSVPELPVSVVLGHTEELVNSTVAHDV